MKLVLFTCHYPFIGEPFLIDEIRIAESLFDEIIIVTREADERKKMDYFPENGVVIAAREGLTSLRRAFLALPSLFTRRFWRELVYARKTTHHSLKTVFCQLLITESDIAVILRSEKKWAGRIEPENTVFCSYWLDGAASYLCRYGSKKSIRIARTHGGDCFFDRSYHPYRREQLRDLDMVYPISELGRDDLLIHYSGDCEGLENKIRVARLGVAVDEDMENPWKKGTAFTIVSCSNVIPLKRLDLLIDALSHIKDQCIRWIHFGDGSEMNAVQALAREKLSALSNLSFQFRGYVPKSEILRFYCTQSVDLFVNCSDAEGIPVSMMEAMACEIPAVGRCVGGISELLDDTCGRLLPANTDGLSLARAITDILNQNDASLMAMRKNAGKRVQSQYSADKNYTEFYESLIGRNK